MLLLLAALLQAQGPATTVGLSNQDTFHFEARSVSQVDDFGCAAQGGDIKGQQIQLSHRSVSIGPENQRALNWLNALREAQPRFTFARRI